MAQGNQVPCFCSLSREGAEPGFKSRSFKLTRGICSVSLVQYGPLGAKPVSVSAGMTVSGFSVAFLPLLIGQSSEFLKCFAVCPRIHEIFAS